jgi:hypothetical protein
MNWRARLKSALVDRGADGRLPRWLVASLTRLLGLQDV